MADGLGCDRALVVRDKARGMPMESLAAARQWRRANVRPRAGSEANAPMDGDIPDYQESRARREAAEAQLAEYRAMKEAGTLVEAAVVRAEFAKALALVRDAFLALPARMAPVLAAESDVRRVQAALDAEVRSLLGGLAGADA